MEGKQEEIPKSDYEISEAMIVNKSECEKNRKLVSDAPEDDQALTQNFDILNQNECVNKFEDSGNLEAGTENKDEWHDILGSGVIMKKIIFEGIPDSRPERTARCVINYECRLQDGIVVESVQDFELRLGECDVVQGLDVAIGLMNLKEKCTLRIEPRLAFGEKGLHPNIPGNTIVCYDVELTAIEPEDDIELLTVADRRAIGNKKRERGNWWYQRGDNTQAIQCYRRALDYLDEVESGTMCESKDVPSNSYQPTDSELQALLEDRLKVSNNMASAQIKMELYDQALLSLQTVLRCQPNNVKALFRKAKIQIVKNDLQAALKCLEKARSLEPEDGLIAKEINIVNGLIQKQKTSEREYARRMFGGTSKTLNKISHKRDEKRSDKSKLQIWSTLGTTFFIGLVGVLVYKAKYP
ncbi:peptidyl-prolyl cis-trans isomerase FKBP8 [Cylas formicarius]|uniref:peptidyl-prolyl cis-trans isomerase FKBP8 n=1 Tax=Cylas formicarius TaxID=197179 RepID=UPI0029587439|nr:peptidyl-prolyl cis-trans isomerase FKBP8 [Cylas formicarius]